MASWVGQSLRRREDPELLTGKARYIADLARPGMLHAAFLRSPHAHARIRSIDASAARRLAGVHAVLTGASPQRADAARERRRALGSLGSSRSSVSPSSR